MSACRVHPKRSAPRDEDHTGDPRATIQGTDLGALELLLLPMSHTTCFPPQVLHSGKRAASGVPGLEVVSMGKLEVGKLEGRQPM